MDEIKTFFGQHPVIALYIVLVLVYVVSLFIGRIRDDLEYKRNKEKD